MCRNQRSKRSWWRRLVTAIRWKLVKRCRLARVLSRDRPPWDREPESLKLAKKYGVPPGYPAEKLVQVLAFWNPFGAKAGYKVEFLSTEEWAERFNHLKPEVRISSLSYPVDNVSAFVDPEKPSILVCCLSGEG